MTEATWHARTQPMHGLLSEHTHIMIARIVSPVSGTEKLLK